MEARIGCASGVIGGMRQAILRRRELSTQTKLRVVNAMVIPVFNVLMHSMGTTKRSEVQDPCHVKECIEEDRESDAGTE